MRNLFVSRCECYKQVLSLLIASLQFVIFERSLFLKEALSIVFVGLRARKQQQARNAKWVGQILKNFLSVIILFILITHMPNKLISLHMEFI